MRFQGGLEGGTCARTQTEGTFVVSGECTPTTIRKPTGGVTTTISIYAMPVFLGGQKLVNPSTPTQSTSRSTTPTPSTSSGSSSDGSSPSIGLKVGLGVGITLGVILLLALCGFWLIRRYRKKKAWKMQHYAKNSPPSTAASGSVEANKPELVGSTFQSTYAKAELDPLATRAELEAPYEGDGPGIFVHKPELQGTSTSTRRGGRGVYVKRKGELEVSFV
ncbi:hypothetical protein F5Y14DRAFT_406337 [Nemania sp. NC0429]|nr:hypothetical protein F5Y14DRAFT_406337 [Nemania sp. NC0429]